MAPHKGKRLFITGIPTAGKSYLAKKLANAVGGKALLLDDFRESLATDPRHAPFVNFYHDKDEGDYYAKTSPAEQWKNLVWQSEGLWPAFLEKIAEYADDSKPVIFESVSMLPHLAKKDIDFPGVCLIGTSYEETLKRNIESPRWGNTAHLQELEAKSFFFVERPKYREEAERCGYPTFESADQALEYCLKLLK